MIPASYGVEVVDRILGNSTTGSCSRSSRCFDELLDLLGRRGYRPTAVYVERSVPRGAWCGTMLSLRDETVPYLSLLLVRIPCVSQQPGCRAKLPPGGVRGPPSWASPADSARAGGGVRLPVWFRPARPITVLPARICSPRKNSAAGEVAAPGAATCSVPDQIRLTPDALHAVRRHPSPSMRGDLVRLIAPLFARSRPIIPASSMLGRAAVAIPVLSGPYRRRQRLAALLARQLERHARIHHGFRQSGTLAVDLLGAGVGWRIRSAQ